MVKCSAAALRMQLRLLLNDAQIAAFRRRNLQGSENRCLVPANSRGICAGATSYDSGWVSPLTALPRLGIVKLR
jgi:hypothetical protein